MIVSSGNKKKNKTKANSPYTSIKNRVSIERNYGHKSKAPTSNALHGRSNSSLAIMKPARNIDSGFNHNNFTAEKKNNKRGLRNSDIEMCQTNKESYKDSLSDKKQYMNRCFTQLNYQRTSEKNEERNVTPTKDANRESYINMADVRQS